MPETDTYSAAQLSSLPARNGFRQRGMDMTRIETFTDAAFAFAVTLLVLTILIYVYPLKAIYSGAIDFFSGGFFGSYFGINSAVDLRDMFVIFGTAYVALSGIIALLYRHALRMADRLSLSELEVFDSETDKLTWVFNAGVGLISIALALALPGGFVVLAGMWYAVLGIVMPWHSVRRHKLRKAMTGARS